MSEEWNAFVRMVDDKLATFILDIGISETAPDPTKPYLMIAYVKMLRPNEEGFCEEDEAEDINSLEDALTEMLEDEHGCLYVCRMTIDGQLKFYFYAPKEEGFAAIIETFNKAYPKYPIALELEHDPEWSVYLVDLYPDPLEMQLMRDYDVITQLEINGDQLETPRMVTHFAYFLDEPSRDKFVEAVQQQGFTFSDWSTSYDTEAEHRFGVIFEREDPVHLVHVNEVSTLLFELAEEFNGDYDGWETGIVPGEGEEESAN